MKIFAAARLGLLKPLPLRALLLGALAARVVFCLAYLATNPWELLPLKPPYFDFAGTDGHLQIARTLWESGQYAYAPGGFAVHNRPPLPPFSMLLFGAWSVEHWHYYWFGGSILISLAGLFFADRITKLLGFNALQKNVAMLAIAFHPYLIVMARSTSFVNLGITVLLFTVWAVVRLLLSTQKQKSQAALAGFALGVAALTHGSFLPLTPVAAALAFYFFRKNTRTAWQNAAILTLVATATVLPWTLRNALLFQRFIPVATGAGMQYWKGEAYLAGQPHLEAVVYQKATGKPLEQKFFGTVAPEDDALLLKLAAQDAQQRPFHFITRTAQSLLLFWAPADSNYPRLKQALTAAVNLPLLALFFYSLILFLKKPTRPRAAASIPLVFAATLALVFALLAAITSYFPLLIPLLVFFIVSNSPFRLNSPSNPKNL